MKYIILVLVIIFAVYETVMLIKGIIKKVKEKKTKEVEKGSEESIEKKNEEIC